MMDARRYGIDGATLDRAGRPRAGTAPLLLGFLLLGGLLSLVSGCQEDTGVLPPNQPPVTYLSVLGSDLDTLGYRQILHWWGTDRDGSVAAYLIKWDSGWTPPDSARHWDQDPSWIVTTATRDTFALATYGLADSSCTDPNRPCPRYFGRHTFYVRALDNQGEADPVGRSQEFTVGNSPPVLEWSHSFSRPDSSLPAVAFAWHPTDRDGNDTVHMFLYWLTQPGTAAADTFYTADTLVALGTRVFGPATEMQTGSWTLHVQCMDDSRTRSLPITHTWIVRPPDGEYLLIDNVKDVPPGDPPSGGIENEFFRSIMNQVFPGNYHIMDVEAAGGFRTGREVGPYLGLFKGVVWFSGMSKPQNDAVFARNLALAETGGGLGEYLAGGGRMFIFAQNAVGDSAALSRTFQRNYLGIADWYRMQDLTSPYPDYINGNISLNSRAVLRTIVDGVPDSLKTSSSMDAADFLIVDPDIQPVFWVDPGYLYKNYTLGDVGIRFMPDDQTTSPAPVGILSERYGRLGVSSLIPSRANGFQNRDRVMASILRRVLIN